MVYVRSMKERLLLSPKQINCSSFFKLPTNFTTKKVIEEEKHQDLTAVQIISHIFFQGLAKYQKIYIGTWA